MVGKMENIYKNNKISGLTKSMNIDFTKYQVTCLIFEDKSNLDWKNDILIAVA